ncbi:MAG: hypothetical protein JXL80_14360 [Planctomycetes bacterium]|nr:hypothetical protein [Planctomycetota bacterium]
MAVALAWLVTLAVAVVLVGVAALLTADRLTTKPDPGSAAAASDGASPKGRPGSRSQSPAPPTRRNGPVEDDRFVKEMGNLLGYLSQARVTGGGDGEPSADIEQRLRMAQQLAPVFADRGQVDVPDDLPLGEGWKVLFAVPAEASGPNDTLLLVRAAGTKESVVDFFRKACTGWTAELRPPRTDDGSLTLVLRRGPRMRMITVRQRASGDECVVAVFDAPG